MSFTIWKFRFSIEGIRNHWGNGCAALLDAGVNIFWKGSQTPRLHVHFWFLGLQIFEFDFAKIS